MGYYGNFTFDLTIPADKVEEATKALVQSLIDSGSKPEGLKSESFVSLFNAVWGEDLARMEKPVPLKALASLTEYGPITIEGFVSKKWWSWEEPIFEALGPYVADGGMVKILGEDDEAPKEWVFQDGYASEVYFVNIENYELDRLRSIEQRYTEAVNLLREIRDNSVGMAPTLYERIVEFVGQPQVPT